MNKKLLLLLIAILTISSIYAQDLAKSKWSVYHFSSQETSGEGTNGRASQAIDNDLATYWHSRWSSNKEPNPHELDISFGGDSAMVSAIKLWPRQNNGSGKPVICEVYLSMDSLNWGTAYKDTLSWSGGNDYDYKTITLPTPVKAKYIKYVHISTYNFGDQSVACLAEIGAVGEYFKRGIAANFNYSKTENTNSVSVNFTDNSTTKLTEINSWQWSFPGGSPSSYNGKTPPAITYNTHGSYPISLTIQDTSGITNTYTANINVFIQSQVTDLPTAPWRVAEVSSQELASEGSNGAIEKIFDGDINTYWHSQYSGTLYSFPHHFILDLGDTATLRGFVFYPRQNSYSGKVNTYEFYISNDGSNWGTAVAAGQFDWANNNDNNPQKIAFNTINGRYVKLVMTSAIPGNGNTNVATCGEFKLEGTYPQPFVIANFKAEGQIDGGNVVYTYSNESKANISTIQSYQWVFEGGMPASSTNENPGQVTYGSPGKYLTTLTITDNNGIKTTKKYTVNIYGTDPIMWYNAPAQSWTENLPIGNGRLGAMTFGGYTTDSLFLNEKTCWSGYKNDRDKDGAAYLPEIRQKFFNGDYAGGATEMQQKLMGPDYSGDGKFAYQSFGKVYMTFAGQNKIDIANYNRELDLSKAISSVTYSIDTVHYKREMFATAVDNVIAVKYTASKAGDISFNIKLKRDGDVNTCVADATGKTLIMTEHVGAAANPSIGGVHMECMIKIANMGGNITKISDRELKISNADSVILYIAGATDRYSPDQHQRNINAINGALAKSYSTLKADHIAEYQQYFNRVKLQLDSTKFVLKPINERIKAEKADNYDKQLANILFQYGRYMLISSSRPNDLVPANLQGIWARKLNTPWNADYHTNINLEMNYWPAEVTNLSEMANPLFTLLDSLRTRGRITAQKVYGCRGAVFGHATDIWYMTSPIGSVGYGAWPLGSGWLATHLWEHYLFNKDLNWLRNTGYPILKEYTLFYDDFLTIDPVTGKYVSGPSTSPENAFIIPNSGGQRTSLCMAPACDQQIISYLFKACIKASKLLNVDAALRDTLQMKLDNMAPQQISSTTGRLMEWDKDYQETEPGHRHASHLWGVYPGNIFTKDSTPAFFDAARKSLDYRVANGSVGYEWTRAYAVSFYARFKDGENALTHVRGMLQHSVFNNLWASYSPSIFQIDGNMGITAGIAEMLLQSHEHKIDLLPAKPSEWANGSFKGLKARGGYTVDLQWANNELQSGKLYSTQKDSIKIVYKNIDSVVIHTQPGGVYNIQFANNKLSYSSAASTPVKLSNFNISKINATALLNWTTASESNLKNFEINKKTANTNWEKIGTIKAKGNTDINVHYSFSDHNIQNGTNSYRLKMLNQDGTFTWSTIKSISQYSMQDLVVYPNPASKRLNIKLPTSRQANTYSSDIAIYNILGSLVKKISVKQNETEAQVDISMLPSGEYILKYQNKHVVFMVK